jgi:hypothetical protein
MINKRAKFRFTTKPEPKPKEDGKINIKVGKKPAKKTGQPAKNRVLESIPKKSPKLPTGKKTATKKRPAEPKPKPAKLDNKPKGKKSDIQRANSVKPSLSRLDDQAGKEKTGISGPRKSNPKRQRGKGQVISGGKAKKGGIPPAKKRKNTGTNKRSGTNDRAAKPASDTKKQAGRKPAKSKAAPRKVKAVKKQNQKPATKKKAAKPIPKPSKPTPKKPAPAPKAPKAPAGITPPPGAFLPGSDAKNLSSDYFFFSLYAYKNELIAMILPDGVEPNLPKGAVTAINPEYFWLSWDNLEKGGVYQQAAEMMGPETKFRIIGPLGDEEASSFDEFGLKLSLNFIEVNNVLKQRNEKKQ